MMKGIALGLVMCWCTAGGEAREIEYERHEFRGEPEPRRADLATFVYDAPFFGACGILPPLHIVNVILESGGSVGGMSPGATWTPFSIDREQYRELVETIAALDPSTLGDAARYTAVKFELDPDFDHLREWESWIAAVCERHRDAYLAKQGSP